MTCRAAGLASALVLFGTTLAACGTAAPAKILRIPLLTPFPNDPALANASELWAESLVYRGLFQLDPGLNIVPDLAVGLPTIAPDGLTYTFTISPSARFADGRAVTPPDVAFSFTRALSVSRRDSPGWNALHDIRGSARIRRHLANSISGITILGRRSLAIHLWKPDSRFLLRLAMPAASILDRREVQGNRRWWLRGAGAGPFRISATGARVILKPNDHYLEGKLGIGSLILIRAGSNHQALRLFQQHQVDAAPVPESAFPALSGRASFVSTDVQRAYYLVAPRRTPRTLRVGLAEALDTNSLAQSTSSLDPLASIVPSAVVPGYPARLTPHVFEPSVARPVLSSGSLVVGAPPSLGRTAVGRWLASRLRSFSVRVIISTRRDIPHLIAMRRQLPDAGGWLYALGTQAWGRVGGRFASKLATGARVNITNGLGDQISAFEDAESMLLEPALVIPLAVQKEGYVVSDRWTGLVPTPFGLEPADDSWTSVAAQ